MLDGLDDCVPLLFIRDLTVEHVKILFKLNQAGRLNINVQGGAVLSEGITVWPRQSIVVLYHRATDANWVRLVNPLTQMPTQFIETWFWTKSPNRRT